MDEDLLDTLLSLSALLSPGPPDQDELHADEVDTQHKLSSYTPRSKSDDTVRILTSFVENLPSYGKRIITKFIANCDNEDTLFNLATHLCTAILFPMKARGGKTPSVTPSPFEEADTDITFDEVASMMVQSSSRKDQPTLKKLCLRRDNYRCLITGFWDEAARGNVPEEVLGDRILNTELAQIIPFSLSKYSDGEQERDIARCWTALYLFFPDILEVAQIGPDNINHPKNAMSLMSIVHSEFGCLRLALESTGQGEPSTYKVITYPGFQSGLRLFLPPPNDNNERIVRFENHGNCDLPSRILLDTHAAIARILHASGKAEDIENIYRERENTPCLAPDGSTDLNRLLLLV
ncbi:predicted protein [Paecilomyces variotii No. 5]|uniref:HNH nuclease domain-containing protein n=1 Tax=Byssochlamys spectabilis (strain No. 5 / NBRC 109023) TaxID=1356009 RepID=V5GC55_BYSSN|nr:predicted protein [Paecilomyces variotii No. 5]